MRESLRMEQQEERDVQLERVAAAKLPTKYGHFRIYAYYDTLRNEEYVALVKGDVIGKHDVLVYVHLQCGLGDVFDSLQCSSGDRLHQAMMIIEAQGEGVLIHLKRENSRNDGIVAQILDDLGVGSIRPLTGNPGATMGGSDDKDENWNFGEAGLEDIHLLEVQQEILRDRLRRSALDTAGNE